MEWLTVVQVWLVISGAILISGVGGLLFLGQRVDERKDLLRFIGLLLLGLGAFILLIMVWQVFVVVLLIVGTLFLLRWICEYYQFRVSLERRGFRWEEVIYDGKAHCIGFSAARQTFFEVWKESDVEISLDVLECYYFIGCNSGEDHQFIFLNGEFVNQNGEVEGLEYDFSQEFLLVIVGGNKRIESPPIFLEELMEIENWVKEKISLKHD